MTASTMSPPFRRLIEETLPIQAISREAAREKSIRQGHIAGLHIWWARRPLVACRGALLGCLLADPGNPKAREQLEELVTKACTWEASSDPKLMAELRRRLLSDNRGRSPRVLDCFAGGGAIPLEAVRLGCETTALDLNPVANLVEICTLRYPQVYGQEGAAAGVQEGLGQARVVPNLLAHDVERWGRWVEEAARDSLAEFYPSDSDESEAVAFLWARTVTCPNPKCRAEIPLIRQLWLANADKKKVALRIRCNSKNRDIRFEVVSGKNIDFDPTQGTMKRGTVKCPIAGCDGALSSSQLRELGRRGEMDMTGVITAVVLSPDGVGKVYRTATGRDRDTFEAAVVRLRQLEKKSRSTYPLVPDESLPPVGSLGFRVNNYGLTKWGDLFNPRQALAISTFAGKVRDAHAQMLKEGSDPEYAKAVATYLALAVDRLADFCSNLCVFNNVGGRGVVHVFGRQALPMVWDYAETNPFNHLGANWRNAIVAGREAIEAASLHGTCTVDSGSATSLPYRDGQFDLVLTDPPYYDSVPYSDLSDFFYVWLKRTLGDLYPELLSTPLTPKAAEIIQNDVSSSKVAKDRDFFERQMARAFSEMNRVLAPGGVAGVVFAHKTTTAWETLVGALLDAGFVVSASWPLHTERPGRLRAHSSAALSSSTWLVCHKRDPSTPAGTWKAVQGELNKRIGDKMDFLLKHGVKGADAMLSAIGPALEVYSRHPYVEKVTGEKVSVPEFLDKVREVTSQQALTNVMESRVMGRVDPPTAFYVLWKWSYEGSNTEPSTGAAEEEEADDQDEEASSTGNAGVSIPADDAFKLAQAVGAEFDVLTSRTGILEKRGETVCLLGPGDREDQHGLGEPSVDGRAPPLIDILHRSLLLWQEGKKRALEDYLESAGVKSNEGYWGVVGGLSRILPMESKEKQLLDGFWTQYGAAAGYPMPATRAQRSQKKLDHFVEETA